MVTGTWATSPSLSPSRHRWPLWRAVGASAVVALLAVGVVLGARRSGGATSHKPVVAVLGVNIHTNDSTLSWLAEGFPQMIVGKLEHNRGVDVVPTTQVRAVLARSGHSADGALTDPTARDLAGRIGATLEARGTIVRDAGKLVLDLTVHDVPTGSLIKSVVLSNTNPLLLADEAAVKILNAADASSRAERFVGLETSSLEAYQHFVQSVDAGAMGRTSEATHELEAAIALDSGFVAAVRTRIGYAIGAGDTALIRRLRDVLQRHADRASDIDQIDEQVEAAFFAGEHAKTEALARKMARDYPRDPRVYFRLVSVLASHGKNEEAKQVAKEALALDSATVAAGNGPCTPCLTYGSLIGLHEEGGDFQGSAEWGRRWIRVQPDAASAWNSLAWTYSYRQQTDSAILLIRRAMSLSGAELWATEGLARMLLVGRRYAAADSVIASI